MSQPLSELLHQIHKSILAKYMKKGGEVKTVKEENTEVNLQMMTILAETLVVCLLLQMGLCLDTDFIASETKSTTLTCNKLPVLVTIGH